MNCSSPLFVDDLTTLSAITGILILLWPVQGAVALAVLAVSLRLRVP